jgi:hypothetical protein
MSVLGVLDHRYRGFRVIEIGGVGVLLALILLVYLAKTLAGSESARIEHVRQQIADERNRVTLLRAEVASLEQPERLETLSSRYLGLQPVDAKHDIDPQALAGVMSAATPPAAPGQAAVAQQVPAAVSDPPAAPAAKPEPATPIRTLAATPPAKPKLVSAKPAKMAAAPARTPVAPVKLAAAAPARPAKLVKATAAVARPSQPVLAAAQPTAARTSELKAPAGDPIGALVQAAGPDLSTETNR